MMTATDLLAVQFCEKWLSGCAKLMAVLWSEVLASVVMRSSIFWNITQCIKCKKNKAISVTGLGGP
jgi:hypothetical protein